MIAAAREKLCPKCGPKPLAEFYPRRSEPGLYQSYCKACGGRAATEYRTSARGIEANRRYQASARGRLLKARRFARRRFARTGSPRTAATLAAIEAELGRMERQREAG